MEQHLIPHSATLLDALAALNRLSGAAMTLFVISDTNHVQGTLTDGDVRRALLRGCTLADSVSAAAHADFKALRRGSPDVELIRRCRCQGITLLPVLDDAGTLCDIIDLRTTHTLLPLSAIVMAGGKGERLRPLTLDTPKPLLQIGGKAIIDYNIEALAACGITDITVTTRYLAHKIADHFARPVAGVQVRCVEETEPLGTIGAATLVEHAPGGATLVMNSDLLTTISFEEMYMRHVAMGAAVTIAVVPYQVSVPFAILSIDDADHVTGLEEKPSYSYYANAGIYIFDNAVLDTLPAGEHTDAPDLVEQAIAAGLTVTYYPINGTWIDIGSPTDFRQATELMRQVNAMHRR
ncbi:MAG: sugar phosphate nucleotidyltransferase [Muribaculaceae bacterium]